MAREEEITNAALEECAEQVLDCKWADFHPRKGLLDIEKAVNWLKQKLPEVWNWVHK